MVKTVVQEPALTLQMSHGKAKPPVAEISPSLKPAAMPRDSPAIVPGVKGTICKNISA